MYIKTKEHKRKLSEALCRKCHDLTKTKEQTHE